MKKTILMATSAIVAAGFAVEASAVDVEMYGQVNKGVMVYDDGADTEFNIVDNDFSSTRLGVKGSQALDNGLTASVLFETEMQSNASNALGQANLGNAKPGSQNTPAATSATFAERHARVGIAGDWGAVFVGQTSTASDGTLESDLAGVGDVMASTISDIGGGLTFRTNTGASSGVTVGGAADGYDGNGRQDTIRYDSPVFNGLQARVSASQGGDLDGGVFYNGKYDAFAVKASLGYVANNDSSTAADTVESQISGSVSVKHDSGLAGTFGYAQQELQNKTTGNDDPNSMYFKVGYAWDMFEVAADYAKHDDNVTSTTADHELTYVGIGGQYNMGNGVSMAAYFKQFDLDLTGTNTDEINVYGVNMRVKY